MLVVAVGAGAVLQAALQAGLQAGLQRVQDACNLRSYLGCVLN